MVRSRYLEAAKVAIILANNEQVKGKLTFWQKFKHFVFNSEMYNKIFNNIFKLKHNLLFNR